MGICRSRISLSTRLQDFLELQENSEDMNVTFEKFSEEFKNDFVNLNLAWLRESFAVEPHDVAVLERCEEHILKPGGQILLGKQGGEVVATLALMAADGRKENFELGKMCVVPKLRGRGIGGQLLEEGIRLAEEELKCRKLTIYSVRSLVTAMHLYTKAGFREVPLETDCPYQRADVKLELLLPRNQE